VTLGDSGFLQISYLGTSPPKTNLSLSSQSEVDYEQIDR